MTKLNFSMSSTQIAEIIGKVGSPLIVIAELLKNAVDASARNIDIFYDRKQNLIAVENDYKGFTVDEIEALSRPGISAKKKRDNLKNENGMFLTGSKGLGLLSVFLLCDKAEILTSPSDNKIYSILLDKASGSVEGFLTDQVYEKNFTRITLKNINQEVLDFLSSESEVRKLRHICSYMYKKEKVPFPKMWLHITGQESREINFSSTFPAMLYDVSFSFHKETGHLFFKCSSPDKPVNSDEVIFTKYDLDNLQKIMLIHYGIKDTIPTRINNNQMLANYEGVPSFEGRIIVYEKSLAGAQLKTYGAGVNIYVNEFALYNYLAEENDWLGLADFSQRKKVTRLKPHNVFGYVNFPCFDENIERLQISNERADFIQDITFSKLMYLLKGVVMFAIFNIDIADKNPKFRDTYVDESMSEHHNAEQLNTDNTSNNTSADTKIELNVDLTHNTVLEPQKSSGSYTPESAYSPKQYIQRRLIFTREEGQAINVIKGTNDLCNKIYNIVYELSSLDLQVHRFSIAYLYRALLESSTKYLALRQTKVRFVETALENSIVNSLNYFGSISRKGTPLSQKTIKAWRDAVTDRKLIDTLNEYIHNELPVDANLLQETWNTMKSYVIACLTIS